MRSNQTKKSPEEFWREYEENIGEKILVQSLGQYISGWEEFDDQGHKDLWGIILSTSGGFRFHHFPRETWLDSFSWNRKKPEEKIFFIPKENIISAELIKKKPWWKKIFWSSSPHLVINYRLGSEDERQLLVEVVLPKDNLAESLRTPGNPVDS